jgi:hypothetical protein
MKRLAVLALAVLAVLVACLTSPYLREHLWEAARAEAVGAADQLLR